MVNLADQTRPSLDPPIIGHPGPVKGAMSPSGPVQKEIGHAIGLFLVMVETLSRAPVGDVDVSKCGVLDKLPVSVDAHTTTNLNHFRPPPPGGGGGASVKAACLKARPPWSGNIERRPCPPT